MWFVIAPLYLLLFKIKIHGGENLRGLKRPMIIVTNHIQWHDPWFIRFVLGFNSPLLPLRFMASKIFISQFTQFFYSIGLIPFVYFLFGAFTIEQGKGLTVNLSTARGIVQKGGVVIFFPEGSMNRAGSVGKFLPFKKGAAALAMSEGISILPMFIKRKYNGGLDGNGWRDELVVRVGKVFKLEDGRSIEEGTEEVRGVVEGLAG